MHQFASIHAKSGIGWHLHLAIADADADGREALWYGPWDMVLRNYIFASFCQPPYLTITYPQFPVSKKIDTYNSEDDMIVIEDSDDEEDGDDDEDSDESDDDEEGNDGRRTTCSPSASPYPTTPHKRKDPIRHAAPSPETFRGSPSELMRTPPKLPASRPRKKRSTRIPDFAQLLYKLKINPDGTIDRPVRYMKRILLLVEIKRCRSVPIVGSFLDLLPQTDQQARHAFATCPDIRMLGFIIAIGAYWTYVEYDRNHIRPSPSRSEQKDPTYMSSTPTPYHSSALDYPPFTSLIASEGFLCLEKPSSDQGLIIIQKRLKQLSGM